jgi:hypothetical protein
MGENWPKSRAFHSTAKSKLAGASHMIPPCGIDFGTSNSSVGVCNAGVPRLLPIQRGATSVPTALFFSFDDDSTTFALEALERHFAREPGRYLRAIKSILGTKLFGETTQVKKNRYGFGEIIAAFLRFLRTAAGDSLGALPASVVLGRPAFFVDDDPEADAAAERQLEGAARAAGFERSPSSSSRLRPRSTMSRASMARRLRSSPISAAARRTSRWCGSRPNVRNRATGARTFSHSPVCTSAARISTDSWDWQV